MSEGLPAKIKGAFLEDTVGDIFRGYGFDVTKRIRLKDRFDVEHEIDVLATKKEDYGTITTAVECKYHNTQIGIEEIRNFHEKLVSLGLTKGIVVSVGGFSSDAKSQARVLGIELWDLATLQDKLERMQPQAPDLVDEGLPVNEAVRNYILPSHLLNNGQITLKEDVELAFRPYYFVEYHCFSQDRAGGSIVNLESGGVVVVSGSSGGIEDCMTSIGVSPTLPKNGWLAECAKIEPRTVHWKEVATLGLRMKQSMQLARASIKETEAKAIVQREIAKNLSQNVRYWVGKSLRQKVIRPKRKDIEVTKSKFAYVPFLTASLSSKETNYKRILQATTLKYVEDETALCLTCSRNPAVLLCEVCGRTECSNHSKQCLVCGKNLCEQHTKSKGLVFKKYYCSDHYPGS